MKLLLNVLLAFLATKLKDKSIEDLKQLYDTQEDLTPELEDKLIEEFSWIFEAKSNRFY